jgi:anti-sigma factor (TIGR02949 family)
MADDICNCRDLEERLAPYVDGEAPPGAIQSIEAHLAACPPCREQAEAERATRDLVRASRGALTARAPESLRASCAALARVTSQSPDANAHLSNGDTRLARFPAPASRSRSLIRRWAPLSLAATLVLAVVGVFALGLNDRVEALATSLTVDHVKCFKVGGADTHTDAAAAAQQWRATQGWDITVPPTDASQQLTLVGARRCFSTDGRAAHLLYTWRGAPISLYILRESAGRDRVVEKLGHEAVIWSANGRTYAVVADGGSQDLARIVDHMKAHAK